jgi:hypothetical protein
MVRYSAVGLDSPPLQLTHARLTSMPSCHVVETPLQPSALPARPSIDCAASILGIQHIHRAQSLSQKEGNQEEISFNFCSRQVAHSSTKHSF